MVGMWGEGQGLGARNINYRSTNGIEYKVNAKVHYLLKLSAFILEKTKELLLNSNCGILDLG